LVSSTNILKGAAIGVALYLGFLLFAIYILPEETETQADTVDIGAGDFYTIYPHNCVGVKWNWTVIGYANDNLSFSIKEYTWYDIRDRQAGEVYRFDSLEQNNAENDTGQWNDFIYSLKWVNKNDNRNIQLSFQIETTHKGTAYDSVILSGALSAVVLGAMFAFASDGPSEEKKKWAKPFKASTSTATRSKKSGSVKDELGIDMDELFNVIDSAAPGGTSDFQPLPPVAGPRRAQKMQIGSTPSQDLDLEDLLRRANK
jgi:hypothetical protein